MECIFCQIAAHHTKADILSEDEQLIIVKDIHPKAPTHLLVIPKKHIHSVNDLTDDDKQIVAAMIFRARDTAVQQGLEGYKLVFNVGRRGGQIIDHVHLHLLGGWEENRKILDV